MLECAISWRRVRPAEHSIPSSGVGKGGEASRARHYRGLRPVDTLSRRRSQTHIDQIRRRERPRGRSSIPKRTIEWYLEIERAIALGRRRNGVAWRQLRR